MEIIYRHDGIEVLNSCKNLEDLKDIEESLKTVDMIAESAFADNEFLTEINIPENIVKIGQFAFARCKNLKKITLPQNTLVGRFAFYNSGLSELIINDSDLIQADAFRECKDLQMIKINSGHTIASRCFSRCDSLKDVILPKEVHYIGDRAFYKCEKLESINLLGDVRVIGSQAFEHTNLLIVKLKEDVFIHEDAFDKSVVIKKIKGQENFVKATGLIRDSIAENSKIEHLSNEENVQNNDNIIIQANDDIFNK